jgi:feruloyl esterase
MQNLAADPLDYVEGGTLNARREAISRELDSTDPNLRPFAARGGKLIVTIGTNDTLASPGAQLDYYQSVLDAMGRQAVDAFARFFVIPQATHGLTGSVYTTTGDGKAVEAARIASDYERFAYLVNWVERGIAPDKTLRVSTGDRTMPLCSYPTYPKYVSGPAAAASSYTCTQ